MIILVRHPETLWNANRIAQGRKEGPLTAEGIADAIDFVKTVSIPAPKAIYYADNIRCSTLAGLLWQRYPEANLAVEPRLNERDFGIYEGVSFTDIDEATGGFDPDNLEQRYNWRPPRGESFSDVSTRVNPFISELRQGAETVVCITSGGVIRNILHKQQNLSLAEMFELKIGNLSVFQVE